VLSRVCQEGEGLVPFPLTLIRRRVMKEFALEFYDQDDKLCVIHFDRNGPKTGYYPYQTSEGYSVPRDRIVFVEIGKTVVSNLDLYGKEIPDNAADQHDKDNLDEIVGAVGKTSDPTDTPKTITYTPFGSYILDPSEKAWEIVQVMLENVEETYDHLMEGREENGYVNEAVH
jgi:hypothetical protein